MQNLNGAGGGGRREWRQPATASSECHVISVPAAGEREVSVPFPYPPYPIQEQFVSRLVTCLDAASNALLESPTGTGKTACVLCACLSWQTHYVTNTGAAIQSVTPAHSAGGPNPKSREAMMNFAASGWANQSEAARGKAAKPRIFYSSRTHSQLSQAISELKRTGYATSGVVAGSRDQLCLDPDVARETNSTTKTHICRHKVKNRTCAYYNNYESLRDGKRNLGGHDVSNIMDIEDLNKFGVDHKLCPYYYSREMSGRADIVFLPYNYLIDKQARKAHGIDLNNSVIIFDEGHNIEQLCEDCASFTLSSTDVAAGFRECQKLLESMKDKEKDKSLVPEEETAPLEFTCLDVAHLASVLNKLEQKLLDVNADSGRGTTLSGSVIYSWLDEAGVTSQTAPAVLHVTDKICSYLTEQNQANQFLVRPHGVLKMNEIFKMLYPDPEEEFNIHMARNLAKVDFKMHVSLQEERMNQSGKNADPWAVVPKKTTNVNDPKPRVLNYWCFNAGYAMKQIVAQGVRSVVITSGTLTPLESFSAELKLNFPYTLQNPHIASRSQFLVGVVKTGPSGTFLSSTYENRTDRNYLNDLGMTVYNISKVVPHGLLVFFPSYVVMQLCVDHWRSTDMWARINARKTVFLEPRNKSELPDVMMNYTQEVRSKEKSGAALFAVCRGKVSEGLDFSDINGRAVIITGIPYPPKVDPRVSLKIEYLDRTGEMAAKREPNVKPTALCGRFWYQQQAVRAVNQAIGRVLRHRHDYGAILLCEQRFAQPDVIHQLSSWVQPAVKVYQKFDTLPRDLTLFFKNAALQFPYAENEPKQQIYTSPSKSQKPGMLPSILISKARHNLPKSNEVVNHLLDNDWSSTWDVASRYLASQPPSQKPSAVSVSTSSQAGTAPRTTSSKRLFLDENTPQSSHEKPAADNVGAAKKKIKLVANKQQRLEAEQKMQREIGKVVAQHVKESLDNETYLQFKRIIGKYRSDKSSDFKPVGEFLTSNLSGPEHSRFRCQFESFVHENHRPLYTKLCSQLDK